MEEILKLANKFTGLLAINGFGTGKGPDRILELMAKEELVKRDFLIVDSFKHKPPHPAYDFRHKVPNVLKKECTLIKESITKVDHLNSIGILYIEAFDKQELIQVLRHYYSHISNPGLIIVDNKNNDQFADAVISFTDKKETSPVRRSDNFSYFIKRENPLIKTVNRTKSILT
jgi:hypothetical protein